MWILFMSFVAYHGGDYGPVNINITQVPGFITEAECDEVGKIMWQGLPTPNLKTRYVCVYQSKGNSHVQSFQKEKNSID